MHLGLHWLPWTLSVFSLHTRGGKERGLIGKLEKSKLSMVLSYFCSSFSRLLQKFSAALYHEQRAALAPHCTCVVSPTLRASWQVCLPLHILHRASASNQRGALPSACHSFPNYLETGREEKCSLLSQCGSIKINSLIFISHLSECSRYIIYLVLCFIPRTFITLSTFY